jgi:hypothetical protein
MDAVVGQFYIANIAILEATLAGIRISNRQH